MKFPLFFSLTFSSVALGQTDIANFSAATNDRFANDPSFVGAGFDFSGVGRTTQGNGRWATLIADNIFVTANHFPAAGNITFFEGNSPTSTSHTRSVAGTTRIGGTDFRLGYFNNPLPTTIERYSFATVDLSSTGAGLTPLPSQELAITLGITPTTGTYASNPLTNAAVGVNRIEFFQEDAPIQTPANIVLSVSDSIITVRNEAGDPGFTTEQFESALNSGDSGSPLFTINGPDLVLSGIAGGEGTLTLGNGDSRDFSAYSYIGNYDQQVQDFINVNLIAVPEPSSALLLSLGSGLFLRNRRRS